MANVVFFNVTFATVPDCAAGGGGGGGGGEKILAVFTPEN